MKFLASAVPQSAVLLSVTAAASLLLPTSVVAAPAPAPAPTVKTFHSPGQIYFKVPKGVSQVEVNVVGSGGGGGGGGGNDKDDLTGSGGGGGGSAAGVSCVLPVQGGRAMILWVAKGGQGGTAGNGRDKDGFSGGDGNRTTLAYGSKRVSAEGGKGGRGGDASGKFRSGYGVSGGKGGNGGKGVCEGRDGKKTSGTDGSASKEASKNNPTAGAFPGASPLNLKTCTMAGAGGYGGQGAGSSGGGAPVQEDSNPGKPGYNGCVVLTYTAKTGTS
jgi:hypothetical protein